MKPIYSLAVLTAIGVPAASHAEIGVWVRGFYNGFQTGQDTVEDGWNNSFAHVHQDRQVTDHYGAQAGISQDFTAHIQTLTGTSSGFAESSLGREGAMISTGNGQTGWSRDKITVGGHFAGTLDIPVDLFLESVLSSSSFGSTNIRVDSLLVLGGGRQPFQTRLTTLDGTGFGVDPSKLSKHSSSFITVASGDTFTLSHEFTISGSADSNTAYAIVHSTFSVDATSTFRFNAPTGVTLIGDTGHHYEAVPEPASLAAIGVGVIGLLRRRRAR